MHKIKLGSFHTEGLTQNCSYAISLFENNRSASNVLSNNDFPHNDILTLCIIIVSPSLLFILFILFIVCKVVVVVGIRKVVVNIEVDIISSTLFSLFSLLLLLLLFIL